MTINKSFKFISGLAGLILLGSLAQAQMLVLSPGSNWQYTTVDPTANTSWTTSTTGDWSVGQAPFGNAIYNGITDFAPKTNWAPDGRVNKVPDDLWVRTTINLTNYSLSSVRWSLGVDNGYKLFINGTQVSSGFAEGYTNRWEYTGLFSSTLLTSGTNYIALALDDRGGFTAFDMQVAATPVPEASTYGLMAAGSLAGLAFWRRRRRTA